MSSNIFNETSIEDIIDVRKSKLVYGHDINEMPLITIIMPVYNHPSYLAESVLSAVNQETEIPYEIIVVDNNHPQFQVVNQRIVETIGSERIKYYVNVDNIRFTGSCNMGIALARSKYVMFCHDDDVLMPNAISTLINIKRLTNTNFEAAAILGNYFTIDENGIRLSPYNEWHGLLSIKAKGFYQIKLSDYLQKNYTNGCGALYNRDKLIEIGGFCKEYSPCSDYAMNVKYTSRFGAYAIKEYTFKYRITAQSDTSKVYMKMADIHDIIKNEIIQYCGLPSYYKRYIIMHNEIFNYHMYSKWSEEVHPFKIKILVYRCINRAIDFLYAFSRLIRNK